MTAVPLDTRRMAPEARRAVAEAGFVPELVGAVHLVATPDPDVLAVVATDTGQWIAEVPVYRLRDLDPERLRRAAAAALEGLPTGRVDQVLAGIAAGDIELHDDPTSEYVAVAVAGWHLYTAHRCCLVEGWPEHDRTTR